MNKNSFIFGQPVNPQGSWIENSHLDGEVHWKGLISVPDLTLCGEDPKFVRWSAKREEVTCEKCIEVAQKVNG